MDNEKDMAEKKYIKEFLKRREKEELEKAMEIFCDIKKDLDAIKGLKDYEKIDLLNKIKSYESHSIFAYDFFMQGKNMD